MIIDFIVINITNIYLASILLSVLYLNDKNLYLILIVDIILNNFPIITILIIILYKFQHLIFKFINKNIITEMIILTIFYFIFGVLLYGIYNNLDSYILSYLLKYLTINLIIYYIGIKYLKSKYN